MADTTSETGAVITPEDDGPYYVRGSFRVQLPSGQVVETEEETWLCRCGGSQDKPFCDGTHSKIGFQAAERAVAAAEAAAAAGAGVEGGFQAVGDAASVGEGDLLGAEVGGRQVVVGRVDGQLYCIGGICTHQNARLADGDLDGTTVMCPLHNSGFDIRTGQPVRLPAEVPVPTYAVREEDGRIVVSTTPRGGVSA